MASTGLVVWGWAWFMNADSFPVIWGMFGIANQTLAVIALAIASAWMVSEGKQRYLLVTLLPLAFVLTTTTVAGAEMITTHLRTILTQLHSAAPVHKTIFNSLVQGLLIVAMLACALIVIGAAAFKATGPSQKRGFPIAQPAHV
jgi:carbon starvation protein CstA